MAELDSNLSLLPTESVLIWLKKYPSLNLIMISNYEKHSDDLLDTTKQLITANLEDRLIAYLRTKAMISGSNICYCFEVFCQYFRR